MFDPLMKPYLQHIYQGSSKHYCGGHCVSGPDRQAFYFALVLIFIPAFLFYGFVSPWWITNMPYGWLMTGISIYSAGVTVSSLLMVAYSDPGIIPRGASDPSYALEGMTEKEERRVRIRGVLFELKYCTTCHIYRPPRSVHCRICDNCVDRYDHHCPWVGNCVGKRNYRYFYVFVNSAAFNLLYAFIFSTAQFVIFIINDSGSSFGEKLVNAAFTFPSPASIICAVYAFFLIWSLGGLGIFHTYISCKAETTNEDLKGIFKRRKNPHSYGRWKNYFFLVCPPLWPRFEGPSLVGINEKHFPSDWDGQINTAGSSVLGLKEDDTEICGNTGIEEETRIEEGDEAVLLQNLV